MAKPAPRTHRKGVKHVAKGQNMKKEKKKPKKEKK